MNEPMLTIPDIMRMVAKTGEGRFSYPMGEGVYDVLRTWYNDHILHIDIYKVGEWESGDPIEKWLILQRKNLFDARLVTNDDSENFVMGVYENIIKIMDKEEVHVYVEMFEGCIENVKVFDSNEKYQEAYKKWKAEMEIIDEPTEEAYLDDGTSVQGFEVKLE